MSHPFENEQQANAYAIADNRLNELSSWDDSALAELLNEIDATKGMDLSVTGFSQMDLDELVASITIPDFGEDDLPQELEDFSHLDQDDRYLSVLLVFDPNDDQHISALHQRLGLPEEVNLKNKRTFHLRDLGWVDE